MAETVIPHIAVWGLRAEDVELKRSLDGGPSRLCLGAGVCIVIGDPSRSPEEEAAAIRRLVRVAAEVASELERLVTERQDGSDEGSGENG